VPKPKAIRYRIVAKVATVDKADYMASTRLMNLLAGVNPEHPDADAVSQINVLSKGFQFGNSLALRAPQQETPRVAYSFAPAPDKKEVLPNHESSIYSFGTPMRMLNVPYVTMTAEIAVDDTGLTPTSRKTDKALLAGTKFWPVEDADIVTLAGKIASGKNTAQAKVQAILEWLTPGKNIEFGGPVVGSRWGVKKVLNQKQGQCWDFSDCFVTLARASGVPCRQVAGWLYGTSGHVWAEILVDGKHWQQVDPTGSGKLKCGIYHIPYFATEDGNMPIQYVSIPKIEIVEPKQ
jgi:transglutaminase/protease-like cytokinesis protein 3